MFLSAETNLRLCWSRLEGLNGLGFFFVILMVWECGFLPYHSRLDNLFMLIRGVDCTSWSFFRYGGIFGGLWFWVETVCWRLNRWQTCVGGFFEGISWKSQTVVCFCWSWFRFDPILWFWDCYHPIALWGWWMSCW